MVALLKIKQMKVFIAVLVLIFSLQSWTKADDVRDLQIEGMSVGDSLYDHFIKKEIDNAKVHFYPKVDELPNTTFQMMELSNTKIITHTYDEVKFVVKKNDKKKIIQSVEGYIYYKKNINECVEKRDEIFSKITDYLSDKKFQIFENRSKHRQDKSKKSVVEEKIILFSSGAVIRVSCTDWSKKMGFLDELRVVINSEEFSNYLRLL